jgi:hypothetical protein
MNKVLLLSLFILGSLSIQASDENFMEFGAKDFIKDDYKTSNWLFELGYSHLPYELVLPEFEGKYDKVKEKEEVQLSGLSLGFGGQVYFGAGFSSTLKLGVTHYQAFENVEGKATEELDDENLAEYKLDQTVQTAEATLGFEYLIETRYMGIQPFVSFSLGTGKSAVQRLYEYDEDDVITTDSPEKYDVEANEEFNYNKISLGINFISSKGLTSYFTVSQMSINKTDREFKGEATNQAGAVPVESVGSTEIDETSSVTVASIGLGYMF